MGWVDVSTAAVAPSKTTPFLNPAQGWKSVKRVFSTLWARRTGRTRRGWSSRGKRWSGRWWAAGSSHPGVDHQSSSTRLNTEEFSCV